MIAFLIIVVLSANYFLISLFSFDQNSFMPITVLLVVLAVVLHYFLSSSIIDPLLKSDEMMEKTIKETLHELNTPVSTIMMNTKMIQKKCDDPKSSQRLNRIEQSCNDLLELYNSMEYTIKKQIDNVDTVNFDLFELLLYSIEKFDDIRGDITIKNNIHATIMLKTDYDGFKKVLDNLLSNAIKYNYINGKVDIDLDNSWLCISNNGETINTKNLFMIFDEHYQQNSDSKGFGLGLSIVKEFCDLHKIEIKITSKNDKTTIRLNLHNILA